MVTCRGLYFLHLFVAFVHPVFVSRSVLWVWCALLLEQILPISDTLPDRLSQPVLAISVLTTLGLQLVPPGGLHGILIFRFLRYHWCLRFCLQILSCLFRLGSIKLLKISFGPRPSFSFLDDVGDHVLLVGICSKIDLLLLCPHIL